MSALSLRPSVLLLLLATVAAVVWAYILMQPKESALDHKVDDTHQTTQQVPLDQTLESNTLSKQQIIALDPSSLPLPAKKIQKLLTQPEPAEDELQRSIADVEANVKHISETLAKEGIALPNLPNVDSSDIPSAMDQDTLDRIAAINQHLGIK